MRTKLINKIIISILILIFSSIAVCSKIKDPVITGCNSFEYDGRTYDLNYGQGCVQGLRGFDFEILDPDPSPKFHIECTYSATNGACMSSVMVIE